MKKYITRDREAGNIIETFDNYEDAVKAIERYEEIDRSDDCFTENFYEIVEE